MPLGREDQMWRTSGVASGRAAAILQALSSRALAHARLLGRGRLRVACVGESCGCERHTYYPKDVQELRPRAEMTACNRFATPSSLRMLPICTLTVAAEMLSRRAISLLGNPSQSDDSTSS